jgi:GH3 auxin-responsive promoter
MMDATPILKLYGRYRRAQLAHEDAPHTQERQLLRLVRRAAVTRFGRNHDFDRIRSLAAYQERVPLRRYESMWSDYWQKVFPDLTDCSWPGRIPFFALSSGTSSGTSKHIPVSEAMIRANARAATDIMVHHLGARPRSHILAGKSFMLGGSTDLVELAPGVRAGDLSGIAAARVPPWSRGFLFPPRELALIADWEKKVDIVSEAILSEDIRTIAGTPSWLLIFFQRLFARAPERAANLAAFFPNLELFVHGGVNFAPYRSEFATLLQGCGAETREVYAASEGFIAIADRGPAEGMRLLTDNGLFFEFVPVAELDADAPPRHWVKDAELGVDYAIAVTSCAGVWSYVLGDTVRLVSRDPPRVLVTGRTSYYLSAFGEHLTGGELEDAVSAAALAIDAQIADFSVGALFPQGAHAKGSHLYIVEFNTPPPDAEACARFGAAIDRVLSERNDDYRAHRSAGFGLDAPQVKVVKRGTFEAWMKARGRLGGQNKVPRIIMDEVLFANLRAFVEDRLIGP